MTDFDATITFCPTSDLEATTQFYADALGLPLALDQTTCRIFRVAGGGYLGFCASDAPGVPSGLILTLVSDDVDGWHARLAARDVEIESPPRLNERYRIYHFFCRDPNGYRVEIQRFEDPRWDARPGELHASLFRALRSGLRSHTRSGTAARQCPASLIGRTPLRLE